MDILIFGAGGHSKVLVDIIKKEKKYKIAGFIDSNYTVGHKVLDYEVLGSENDLNEIIKKKNIYGGVIGIGDNYKRCNVEKKINKLSKNFIFVNCIHPSSNIAYDVKLGVGNVIMAGATINTSSEIKNHAIFNTNCSIDHDNEIESFSSIAPNAVTGGNVSVGEFSVIGIGATVKHNISIGHNCIIGASSYINSDTKPNSVYFGIPGKFIRAHELGAKYL